VRGAEKELIQKLQTSSPRSEFAAPLFRIREGKESLRGVRKRKLDQDHACQAARSGERAGITHENLPTYSKGEKKKEGKGGGY